MTPKTSAHNRTLAIYCTEHGLGYAVLERSRSLVGWGSKRVRGNKNVVALKQINRLIFHYHPDVILLQKVDFPGSRHSFRIQKLHRAMFALTKREGMPLVELTREEVKAKILGRPLGTKREIAEVVARCFPADLASRMPPPRKPWMRESPRMATFEAVALSLAFLGSRLREVEDQFEIPKALQ